MALSIAIAPDNRLHLANEHCIVKLQSNDFIESPGVKEMIQLTFSGIVAAGETITFNVLGKDLVFEARAVLQADGNDLSIGVDASDQRDKALVDLNKNYVLANQYSIFAAGSNNVIIHAKQSGAAWAISTTSTLSNVVISTVSSGVDPVYYDFHKLYAAFYKSNELELAPVLELAVPLDKAGLAEIDFAGIADGFLETVIEFPQQLHFKLRPNHVTELLVRLAEQRGIPLLPVSDILEVKRSFVPGGLSYEKVSDLNEGGTIPFPEYDATAAFQVLPFLTHMPDNAPVFFDQVLKLCYYFYHPYNSVKLYFTLTKKNGFILPEKFQSEISIKSGSSYLEINVSAYKLNLTGWSQIADIVSFSVYLKDDANNIISPVRTYRLRHKHFANKRQFLFRNSCGGVDSLACTGEQTATIEYIREQFEQVDLPDHTSDNAQQITLQNLEQQHFHLSTGYVSDPKNNWLRDFALSKEIYELDDNNRKFRIRLTSKKIFKKKDLEFLYYMEFDFVRAYLDEYYYPLEAKPAIAGSGGFGSHVYEPNLEAVKGIIYLNEGEYTNFCFRGALIEDGERFLILNRASRTGQIYSFNKSERQWTFMNEGIVNSRVLNLDDGQIYIYQFSGKWLLNLQTNTVNYIGHDQLEIKGWNAGEVDIDVYTAASYDSDEKNWTKVVPVQKTIGQSIFTIVLNDLELEQAVFLQAKHEVYKYCPKIYVPDLAVTFNTYLESFNGFNINEHGLATGLAFAIVSGGAEPYTYRWFDESTLNFIKWFPAGDYWCEVTDAEGRRIKAYFSLTEPAPISHEAIVTNEVEGDGSGTIDLNPRGGAGGFTFLWADGPTTEDRADLSAGAYSVTVTDANEVAKVFDFTIENE